MKNLKVLLHVLLLGFPLMAFAGCYQPEMPSDDCQRCGDRGGNNGNNGGGNAPVIAQYDIINFNIDNVTLIGQRSDQQVIPADFCRITFLKDGTGLFVFNTKDLDIRDPDGRGWFGPRQEVYFSWSYDRQEDEVFLEFPAEATLDVLPGEENQASFQPIYDWYDIGQFSHGGPAWKLVDNHTQGGSGYYFEMWGQPFMK